MNRTSLLLAVVISLALPLSAQQRPPRDSLEQEIVAHSETDAVLLGKARAVLLESLEAADTSKARKVMQYMETKFDPKRLRVLYPEEKLLVEYWLGDYSGILLFARTVDAERQPLEPIGPNPDHLYDDLIELSRKNEGTLRMNVRRSDLPPNERDFVLLLLSDMLGRERGDQTQQEAFRKKINDDADAYLTSYADSEYNLFVRKYIRFVVVKSAYGYGYGMALGYLGLPGTLSRHLGNYGLLSLYLEGAYKQIYTYISLDIGWPHDITKGFEYKGTWQDGLSVMQTGVLLGAGPMFELGSGFLAIPTVGISYMDFSPSETEREKTGSDVSISFAAWGVGASFWIPVGGKDGSTFITVNAGYRQAMTHIEMAKGGYSFLTIGFGLFGRPEERDF